jgi:2-desacetyl-2-hydroxyethyl bacteriochlorophyllide A dehydrogenase
MTDRRVDVLDGTWPSGRMRSLAVTGPKLIEWIDVPIPTPEYGEVLVKPAYVGICGTDIDLYEGTSSYLTERRTGYPVIFGHEWSGFVIAAAEGTGGVSAGRRVVGQTLLTCGQCRSCRTGRRSHCENRLEVGLAGHQGAAAEFIRVPVNSLVPVPDTLSLSHAPLVEPSVTVVHGFERTSCGLDDDVVVIGTGTLGLVAVQLAAATARSVDVVGSNPARMALARELGARNVFNRASAPRGSYSVAVEASGANDGLSLSVQLLRSGGRAALLGIASQPESAFVSSMLLFKDLEIHGILHGLDYYDRTMSLFATGRIRADVLIDRIVLADSASSAFSRGRLSNRPKVLIDLTQKN